VQEVTEEIVLKLARTVHRELGTDSLCLAGGVALNCVATGRIQREGSFEHVWTQPAAGDAGAALGCALFAWHELLDKPRKPTHGRDQQRGSLLGPSFTHRTVVDTLERLHAPFEQPADEAALCERVAELLATGHVIGHFAGRMEFGPRALGNRSILADPRGAHMQAVLNAKIKFRESFRPFAPIVLREHAHEYFECNEGEDSPYMTYVTHVRQDKRLPLDHALNGLARLSQVRSVIPAVTHLDHSSRIQTVDRERHPRLHALLSAFHARTSCPVLINTSLNVRGEPIVHTPLDAYQTLMSTGMDALVLQDVIVFRADQPEQNRVSPRVSAD
jgi:carbamoyltransferase